MIRLYWVFLVILTAVCLFGCGNMEETNLGSENSSPVVPNSYILGVWDTNPDYPRKNFRETIALSSLTRIEPIGKTTVLSSVNISDQKFVSLPASKKIRSMTLFRVDLPKGSSSKNLLSKFDQGTIALWEPNRINDLFAKKRVPAALTRSQNIQSNQYNNENFFTGLFQRYQDAGGYWWLDTIGLDAVYKAIGQRDLTKVSEANLRKLAPVIAILDSGIDFLHPALNEKIWVNPKPGLSGCENDTYGCDATLESAHSLGRGPAIPFATREAGEACPLETIEGQIFLNGACIHGTYVAGLIVADDEYGVSGICPHCKVLPIKVVESIEGEGKVPDSAILKGLKYVQNINKSHGGIVKVVNFSFGKFEQSLSVTLVVKELTNAGVMVVGASGNENTSERVFPAALEDVIAVTAVSREGKKASYSNFGSWINLAAPGGDVERGSRNDEAILSTVPGGDVYLSQGTSVAAPLVTGVAGLIQMLEPRLGAKQLKKRLLGSADGKLYDMDFADGYNNAYRPRHGREYIPGLLGRGILDGYAAYLGEMNAAEELMPSQRVLPGCGEIKVNESTSKYSFLILTLFYLMPILFLGLSRGGVS
ncbi:MAG: S8 family serine peptidase [Oligoflexales bacterium]